MTASPRVSSTFHTGVTVSDLDRSMAFYREVLHCEVSDKVTPNQVFIAEVTGIDDPELELAYVTAPGHTIELLCFGKGRARAASRLRPCDPGFLHLAFVVDDLDATLDAAAAMGVTPVHAPTLIETGPRKGWRACYTRDPDGVVLELIEMASSNAS
ncbi:MAG: VOC family protein [Hyphomicrobiales bacterium]